MNDSLRIEIPTQFSAVQKRHILKYLSAGRRSLTLPEWKHVLSGFDLLHQARVSLDETVQTFKQMYTIHVEEPFADLYINELLQLHDLNHE